MTPGSRGSPTEPLLFRKGRPWGRAVKGSSRPPPQEASPRSQSDKDEPQGNPLAASCQSETLSPFKGGCLSHTLNNTAPIPSVQRSSKGC